MNIYFLVEGKTESKVYPVWLAYFIPELKRIKIPSDVVSNNYYLISGGGFSSILDNHLIDSIDDINTIKKYNYLILVIDTDNLSVEQKTKEVNYFINDHKLKLINCELIVIAQKVCMETWFLGNKRIYCKNPSDKQAAIYAKHYNTANDNPELMPAQTDYMGSIGNFHFDLE